jgi:hypothetical protein
MKHLGDYVLAKESFPKLDTAWKELKNPTFKALTEHEKFGHVCRMLLNLIEKAPEGAFLLIPVLDFVERIHKDEVLEHFHFNNFELWLNQFSGLTVKENLYIRGKIAGRYVPREIYQVLFPVGMGKVYAGSHFVTAHGSPDLDTTIASFWGWVDAFAARVSEGLHIWNIPGGVPPDQVEIGLLFYKLFGDEVFSQVAKHRTSLSVSGLDLVTQQGVEKKHPQDSVFDIDHEKSSHAVVLVDKEGFYLGEWQSSDVDRVEAVINLLNQCLRWYENSLHVKLISIFASEKLTQKELEKFFELILKMKIKECEPAKDFTTRQGELVDKYLQEVLGVKQGLECTFAQFAKAMAHLLIPDFQKFIALIDAASVFDKKGKLIEDRATLFSYLAKVIGALENAIYSVRRYVDKLGVALEVKSKVFNLQAHSINYRADLDEIRSKMNNLPYLTVTSSDKNGKTFPIGVIHATELFKTTLGTVSVRDFCNREETKIPAFLDIISTIDHHKSHLLTLQPPVAWITDAQSSNTMVAELSFKITDMYSTGGMTSQEIEKQIKEVQKNLKSPSSYRILRRLLQKSLVAGRKDAFFVSPQREIIEYFHFLYAIFDDTDLLTKVTPLDIHCVASIINRLKSLMARKEVEIIFFDDILHDEHYKKNAAKRILQNDDVYSLYQKIYLQKGKAIEENLRLAAEGKSEFLFSDTKEQNGCCRVGQTKLLGKTFPVYKKYASKLRSKWLEQAELSHEKKSDIDLHLHMISTIPGAEELYDGKSEHHPHQDELWIWIPSTETAVEHLKNFLSSFRLLPQVAGNLMEVEFLGDNGRELKQIFEESFNPIPSKSAKEKLPIAVLRFTAGTINSRKALISPCLPRLG